VQFVCGLQAPEDLVVVPGGRWVVAGAFGNGGVYLIRTSDRTVTRVYPTATSVDRLDAKAYAGCPGPADAATKAKYQTHGLSIQPGANNVHRLLVVLHGGRESIEVFEVDARPATPTVTWIGCAVHNGSNDAPSTVTTCGRSASVMVRIRTPCASRFAQG
jgi:hypothetical protein